MTHPQAELYAKTPAELSAFLAHHFQQPSHSLVRGRAIWRELSAHPPGYRLPEALPECGKASLELIHQHFAPTRLQLSGTQASQDGTLKWSFVNAAGPFETVLIPTPTRSTVCVSTQSGCTRFCDFCATARVGFRGQLSAGEIVAQVLQAKAHAPTPLTNVVMMGMGEPLDNIDAVFPAIAAIDEGLGIAARHITVSTSGVIPKMERLWRETRASLALSLHAPYQDMRNQLMPRVKKWSLDELVAWMKEATQTEESKRRHIFIEYILLSGVNDRLEDAHALAALLRGIRCRINLIPFNPTPGIAYQRPQREDVLAFRDTLLKAGYVTIVRETRGDDTAAACGQLAASLLGTPLSKPHPLSVI